MLKHLKLTALVSWLLVLNNTSFSVAQARPCIYPPLPNGTKHTSSIIEGAYFVEWMPKDIDRSPNNSVPLVVTLHGSHGCAEAELGGWCRFAKSKGYGVLALQWWLGGESYLPPLTIYRLIDDRLAELKRIHPSIAHHGHLLHGFSRASANVPAIAAIDCNTEKRQFCLFVCNSGAWPADNPPPYMEQTMGLRNKSAFKGAHFVGYFGGADEEWGYDAIINGRNLKQFLENYGGSVDLFFDTPYGKHGSFMRSEHMVLQTLGLWDKLRLDLHNQFPR